MSVFGAILTIVLSGFLIGALGRLAVPGPDPTPFWLTVLIGWRSARRARRVRDAPLAPRAAFDILELAPPRQAPGPVPQPVH